MSLYIPTQKQQLYVTHYRNSEVKLTESQEDVPVGMMRVSGVLAKLSDKSRNKGRGYDEQNYTYHLNRLQERIDTGVGVFGELEHPKGMAINNNNVSHKIEKVWYNTTTTEVMGTFLIMDTPKGLIAQSIIKAGGAIRASSRATGYEKTGMAYINNLVTFDIVGSPGFDSTQMYLTENEQALGSLDNLILFESYIDDKIMSGGEMLIGEEFNLWESTDTTDTFERSLNENELNILRNTGQQSPLNEDNMEINKAMIDKLFESQDFLQSLKSNFTKLLVEAEEVSPVEDVIKESMENKYLPGIEKYVTHHYSNEIEKYLIESFAPRLLQFAAKQGKLFESESYAPKNFRQFVTMLRESTEEAEGTIETAKEAVNAAQAAVNDAQEALKNVNEDAEETALAVVQKASDVANDAVEAASNALAVATQALNEADTEDVPTIAEVAEKAEAAANAANVVANAAQVVVNAINNPVNESRSYRSSRAKRLTEAEEPTLEFAIQQAETAIADAEVKTADAQEAANTVANLQAAAPATTVVNEDDDASNVMIANMANKAANAANTAANQAQNLAQRATKVANQLTEAEDADMKQNLTNLATNLQNVADEAKEVAEEATETANAANAANNAGNTKVNESEEELANAVINKVNVAAQAAQAAVSQAENVVNKAEELIKKINEDAALAANAANNTASAANNGTGHAPGAANANSAVNNSTVATQAANVDGGQLVLGAEAAKVVNESKSLLESIQAAFVESKTKSAIASNTGFKLNENNEDLPLHIQLMPENYKQVFESLNESQQELINTQAQTRVMKNADDVKRFWNTRDFSKIQSFKGFVRVDESFKQSAMGSNLKRVCDLMKPGS